MRLHRYFGEERFNFIVQICRCIFYRFRCAEHGLRRLLGRCGRAGDFAQCRNDERRTIGSACDILRNFTRRGTLLLDRRGDCGCVVIDLVHAVCDPPDRFDGLGG